MTNFKILNMGKLLLTLVCLFGSLNAINAQNSFVPLGMSSSQGKPAIFVLAPEGSSATGWTEVAKWKQIATDMQCKVVIIDGNTNSTSTSLTWSVSSDITGLTSIFNNETSSGIEGASRYMVSYGTNAGKVLAQYAKSNTNNLAGIAIVNADLSTYTMTPDTSTLAVPLMLVNSPQSASNSVADFFKIRNATNQSKTVTNGTTFYNNNVTAHNGNLEYTHYVRIATGVADASIPNLLRDDLLTRVARWKTLEGDFTLRTKMVNNPNLFKIQETNASGSSSREAWVYIPSKVLEGTITGAVPMVLMFHGLTMNGKYFMDSTGWQDLAEEFNFIVYAPTGSNWQFPSSDLTRYSDLITKWTGTAGLNVNSKNYTINKNRVYVYGFSNGSYMASDFAYYKQNQIAAAAPWAYVNAAPTLGTASSTKAIPVWYGRGSNDGGTSFNSSETSLANYFKYHAKTTNTSTISQTALGNPNLIKTTVYGGGDRGIEVRMSMATNVVHGQLHEHVRRLWVDFFSKYQKNSFGETELISAAVNPTSPTAATAAATLVTPTNAKLNATVSANNAATTITFEYGTTTNYGSTVNGTPNSITGTTSTASSAALIGLVPNTTYNYRVKAVNSAGTTYGDNITFTTPANPSSLNLPVTENFNASALPSQWTSQNVGTGITERWSMSNTANAGGTAYEARCSYQQVSPATTRLITPPINTVGSSQVTFSFKHMLDAYASGITLRVQTSNDKVTWTNTNWSVVTSSTNIAAATVNVTVTTNLNAATTYFALVADGNLYQMDNWYIDNVSITSSSATTSNNSPNIAKTTINSSSKSANTAKFDGVESSFPIISAYPNPTSGRFLIQSDADVKSINVYSITGVRVYSRPAGQTSKEIDFTNFENGVYLLVVSDGKKSHTIKVIKE